MDLKLPRGVNTLLSLHEAIAEAQQDYPRGDKIKDLPPMITCTFRIPQEIKVLATEICARHDITIGQFLRKCCEILPREYR